MNLKLETETDFISAEQTINKIVEHYKRKGRKEFVLLLRKRVKQRVKKLEQITNFSDTREEAAVNGEAVGVKSLLSLIDEVLGDEFEEMIDY